MLEIILIVVAWRKGWRGWALVPSGVTIAVAFLLGTAASASGSSPDSVGPIALLLVLANLGVLIRLAVCGPQSSSMPTGAATAAVSASMIQDSEAKTPVSAYR